MSCCQALWLGMSRLIGSPSWVVETPDFGTHITYVETESSLSHTRSRRRLRLEHCHLHAGRAERGKSSAQAGGVGGLDFDDHPVGFQGFARGSRELSLLRVGAQRSPVIG